MTIIKARIWSQSFAAVLLLLVSTVAQNQQRPVPDLAVRVDTGEEPSLELLAFNGGSGGTSRFKRMKSWVGTAEQSPVTEVNIKIDREGEVVITNVSVRLTNLKELPIGTYRLRENETATVQELAKVGLEPISLSVVRAKPTFVEPSPPIQPLLENKTKAVEVVNFYREPSIPNTFRLTLRNISTKGIMVLDLFMPSGDGNGGYGQRSAGERDHLVMPPGGTSENLISVTGGGRRTPAGYVPDPPVQQKLIIRTVLFEDGSYEGMLESAAEISAQRSGENLQRKRIVQLFRKAGHAEEGRPALTLEDFKEQVYALDSTSDPAVVRELLIMFPTIGEKSLEQQVKIGLDQGKRALLHYINEFENNVKERRSKLTFAQWLTHTQADYEKRIERF